MRSRLLVFTTTVLMLLLLLAGCGGDQATEDEVFAPEEGTVEAETVNFYEKLGFDVTNVETEDDGTDKGHYFATVTMTTEMDEDAIKQVFIDRGASPIVVGWDMFPLVLGKTDGKDILVTKLFINEDEYTQSESFNVDNGVSYYRNVLKNGDLYLEDEHYQAHLDEQNSEKTGSGSGSSGSSSSTPFTNKYGTPTTICAHPGCNNYIASSGDTNCCTTHSNKCAECGKYIDEDAMFCMDCIEKSVTGQ